MANDLMTQVLAFSTAVSFAVSALLEIVKRFFTIKGKYIPAISFFIGMGVGAAAYPFTEMDLVLRLWAGAIAGWMASGIYETVKKTTKL